MTWIELISSLYTYKQRRRMSSPIANVPSSSTFFPNIKSSILPTESPSTPTSYVSLLDTSQSPGKISF